MDKQEEKYIINRTKSPININDNVVHKNKYIGDFKGRIKNYGTKFCVIYNNITNKFRTARIEEIEVIK